MAYTHATYGFHVNCHHNAGLTKHSKQTHFTLPKDLNIQSYVTDGRETEKVVVWFQAVTTDFYLSQITETSFEAHPKLPPLHLAPVALSMDVRRRLKFTTHLHLVPKLTVRGDKPPLPIRLALTTCVDTLYFPIQFPSQWKKSGGPQNKEIEICRVANILLSTFIKLQLNVWPITVMKHLRARWSNTHSQGRHAGIGDENEYRAWGIPQWRNILQIFTKTWQYVHLRRRKYRDLWPTSRKIHSAPGTWFLFWSTV